MRKIYLLLGLILILVLAGCGSDNSKHKASNTCKALVGKSVDKAFNFKTSDPLCDINQAIVVSNTSPCYKADVDTGKVFFYIDDDAGTYYGLEGGTLQESYDPEKNVTVMAQSLGCDY